MAKQTLEQERQEALAVQNGYVKTSPSFSASAGVNLNLLAVLLRLVMQ